jgi:hypothetical protein
VDQQDTDFRIDQDANKALFPSVFYGSEVRCGGYFTEWLTLELPH